MGRLISILIVLVLASFNAIDADAQVFGRRLSVGGPTSPIRSVPVPFINRDGLAQRKSEVQAREGRMRHIGGSFGGGHFEGVGFSSRSEDEAIRNCCYWGRKTPIDIGAARGRNGWYATVLYK